MGMVTIWFACDIRIAMGTAIAGREASVLTLSDGAMLALFGGLRMAFQAERWNGCWQAGSFGGAATRRTGWATAWPTDSMAPVLRPGDEHRSCSRYYP